MTAVEVEVQVGTTPDVDATVQVEPPTFTVVSVLPTGPRGPAGPEGPEGPEGPAGTGGVTQEELDAEVAARVAADSALDARLDPIEALGPLATDAELATEAGTRAAADTALDGRVDALETAPPTHAASHADGGSDEIAISADQVTSGTFADARIPAAVARDAEVTAAVAAEATARDAAIETHRADTTNVHGIADTSLLETAAGAQAKVDAHVNDPTDAHDASAVSIADAGGFFTGGDVEAALQELGAGGLTQAEIEEIARDALGVALVAGTNVTITPNDGTDTITIDAAAGSGGQVDEVVAGAGISVDSTDPTAPIVMAEVTQAELDGKQASDADLTAIAALAPTNDDIIQRKAGAWTNRTIAQLLTDLAAPGTTFQPLDSDLTAIAALSTTSYGRSLLEAANAAALRTLAGLVIGTDVQGFDADLADLIARWIAASAAGPASLDFLEDTDNGSNRARLTAPSALGADRTLTIPDASGTLALIAQTVANGNTTTAPSEDAVFDAIAALSGTYGLKPIGSFRSTSTSSAIGTTETVVHSFQVTLPASRKVKVTLSGMLRGSGGTNTRRTAVAFLRQGTTTAGTQILRSDKVVTDDPTERRISFSVMDQILDTGAGGVTDFVISILRANGANEVQLEGGTQPTCVTFEDFGAA